MRSARYISAELECVLVTQADHEEKSLVVSQFLCIQQVTKRQL
jgi:hypothetical protein